MPDFRCYDARMKLRQHCWSLVRSTLPAAIAASACGSLAAQQTEDAERWLAGDHHVHSEYSITWNTRVDPPEPLLGTHGVYPMSRNAMMAERFGLDWMVATDHGGRAHARLNLEQAYPSFLRARDSVPSVVQFFGVELNPPGADHASVIVPHTDDEARRVYEIESRFDRVVGVGFGPRGPASVDPSADTEEKMIEALEAMDRFPEKPLVIANHPSRTARQGERYGRTTPAELRAWQDAAPEVAIGMAGAPGHQASGLVPEESSKRPAPRGQYPTLPTLGGFDPMTAVVGGFWDSMLGEGRHWWITANSDSHKHWTEGGNDFWPGEYSKTYVRAKKSHAAILEGLRAGRIFVTTGDLVSELELTVESSSGDAAMGETLRVASGSEVSVHIRVRDPSGTNANGDSPSVRRVDVIIGDVNPRLIDAAGDTNPSARVVARFDETDWTPTGEYLTMTLSLPPVDGPGYVRLRGTSTDEEEPEPDTIGENPWNDLWFYSNPIFIDVD